MIRGYTVEAVRRAVAAGLASAPDGALMRRAGAAVAAGVLRVLSEGGRRAYGARVVLLVGPGANGGDALWAGVQLRRRGVQVAVAAAQQQLHPAGWAALRAAGGVLLPGVAGTRRAAGPVRGPALRAGAVDVVVDGLVGIGGRPGLSAVPAALVARVPAGVPVVAVDLPSGIDPDTGEVGPGAVRAALTVTFGAPAAGLLLPPAAHQVGRLEVVEVGLATDQLGEPLVLRWEAADLAAAWPVPGPDSDKYRRGVLGVVAGGSRYTGAAVLCVGAAVRCGAGMVRYVGPRDVEDAVRQRWPQAVLGSGRVQAWVLGPGVDPTDARQRAQVERALADDVPCVVDAGALDLLDPQRPRRAATVLTPHAGELARLLSRWGRPVTRTDVERAPLEHARAAAVRTAAVVLLKGATTVVVGPTGPVVAQQAGPAWLATAGSGDVLAGVLGSLLAAGLDAVPSAAVAASVHGAAGRRASAGGPVDAGRLVEALPGVVADLLRPSGPRG